MDLVSGTPFWPIADGLPASYPPLDRDQSCQVAVIGAGITGALVADTLTKEGAEVIVLDRRDVATGSTAASTALLSYELDLELPELSARVGERAALRACQLTRAAIDTLEGLAAELGGESGFQRRDSLYLASSEEDVPRLERELEFRGRHGLPGEFWERGRIAANYELTAPAAIRSPGAAEVDPYRLTHQLLARASRRGARIFDRTEVTGYERRGKALLLRTSRATTVQADRVVFALGYEIPEPLRRDIVRLTSTYVLISEPLPSFAGWEDRCLIWETARPYRYLRSTVDGRVLIGGEDEPFSDAARRDAMLPTKGRSLAEGLTRLLPSVRAEPAFVWTGTFGETEDGLPYVGESPDFPGGLFALGYGGNGITAGVVAAEIIRDFCLGRPNPDAAIFRLDRPARSCAVEQGALS